MRPAHGARANETEVPAGFGQRVCREVTWACAQCPVARTGLLAADCDVKEHLLCDFGALLLLLCQRGAGDERQQRKADQKRVRRSHFSVRLETTPLTWTKKKTRRWHEFAPPLPGSACGLLFGLPSCAGALLRGSVASKLQVGTRGVCNCVLYLRGFLHWLSGERE